MMVPTSLKLGLAGAAATVIRAFLGLAGRGPEVRANRRGIAWHLDLREGIDFSIFLLGSFEPSTVKAYSRYLEDGSVALDIGANIGAHTLPMAQLVGSQGRVLAFEPAARSLEKLRANVAANADLAPRVSAFQVLLSQAGAVDLPPEIYSSWPVSSASGRHPLHGGVAISTQGATVRTLDEEVAREGLSRVDFVKMDVDGYEMDVLAGAGETLRRFQPALLMEVAPYTLHERGVDAPAPLRFLVDLGYRFYTLDGAPMPSAPEEIASAVPDGCSVNVLALAR
jgi:FkbM family methyltransferase